jgi:hypothetical protein
MFRPRLIAARRAAVSHYTLLGLLAESSFSVEALADELRRGFSMIRPCWFSSRWRKLVVRWQIWAFHIVLNSESYVAAESSNGKPIGG